LSVGDLTIPSEQKASDPLRAMARMPRLSVGDLTIPSEQKAGEPL
jgi:hypothetical protein